MICKQYDVIVVGAGPAGIFTALELIQHNLSILILEKGKNIDNRKCPMREQHVLCQHCKPCSLLSGWGGGGAFSDGKLNLSGSIGGNLLDYFDHEELEKLIRYVDDLYLQFGANEEIFGIDEDKINDIKKEALKANLIFVPTRIRHLGTEKCYLILKKLYNLLKDHLEIRTSVEVDKVMVDDHQVKGVQTKNGEIIYGKYVVVSPGRVGAEWLREKALELKLDIFNNPVDVGIRVELPSIILEPLTNFLYESKFIYYTSLFDDQVRTFCMCPHGEVVLEYNDGITTVNGHSYQNKSTDNTNFALLVRTAFTEPFKEPISYGKYIANLANILSGGVIIQRLGDLISGRRSTSQRIKNSTITPSLESATPGDLSFVLPYRILSDLIEMLKALDQIAPGVYHKQTLLYGIEVKFYSARLALSKNLETKVKNLFAIGDGAGITRGLIQASVSGIAVARTIKQRMGIEDEYFIDK